MKAKSGKPADRAVEVVDYVTINRAVEKALDLTWTGKNQALLKKQVGAANYRKLEEITAFVSNQDAWLGASNLSAAADVVAGKLSQHFPQLSQVAVFKIVNQATYGWR